MPWPQLPSDAVLAALKPLLEDPATLKIGHNMKFDVQQFARRGITVAPIDDTRLISYAVESGLTAHNMDDLSERHLGHRPISFKEVAGSGRSASPSTSCPSTGPRPMRPKTPT
jgi:DNA polymerase I